MPRITSIKQRQLTVVSRSKLDEQNLRAWNLTEASYGTKATYIDFGVDEAQPQSIYVSSDGLRLYILGISNRSVRQYDLTEAFNMGSAVYVQQFSVSGQDNIPLGLDFHPEGTGFYVSGNDGDDINQYSLSTPWDLSTAAFVRTQSVGAQSNSPIDVKFSPDGIQMFVLDSNLDTIFAYELGTAWDVSTLTYGNISFSVATQENQPLSMYFRSDGGKFYVIGRQGVDLNEYNMSEPFNLQTAAFVSNTASLVSEISDAGSGIQFSPDGTRCFLCSNGFDTVFTAQLTTPWDVSTFALRPRSASDYLDVRGLDGNPNMSDMFFRADGAKMYLTSSINRYRVYEYDLSTPWDIDTATYQQDFAYSDDAVFRNVRATFFHTDGTKMYMIGDNSPSQINEYDLSTPWDVTTAVSSQSIDISAEESSPTGIFIRSDGAKLFTIGNTNRSVNEYDLSTPWDISTAVAGNSYLLNQPFLLQGPDGLYFRADGAKMYVSAAADGRKLFEHDLATPWDISTASYLREGLISQLVRAPRGIWFRPDGTRLFILDQFAGSVLQLDVGNLPTVTRSISAAANSINEGSALTVTVTTTNVRNGTVLNWRILDRPEDFLISTGTVTVSSNTATFTVTPSADLTTEGPETFRVRLETLGGTVLSTTSSITINDTSITPGSQSYSVSTDTSVDELGILTVNVTTVGVNDETVLYWTILDETTNGTDDFPDVSGNFTITSSAGTFDVSTWADNTTEGPETFRVQIRTDSISGNVVATTDSITLNDTSLSPVTGQQVFTTTGVTNWTVPEGVTLISAVAVGAGGGGGRGDTSADGGGGGALAWRNEISVTPGETLRIRVGAGGAPGTRSGLTEIPGDPGGTSDIIRDSDSTVLLRATGGGGGGTNPGAGGTVSVGTGGSGGAGGNAASFDAGGGGAGGYSGNGGVGSAGVNAAAGAGSGGGGSGGGGGAGGAGGGGVGLLGEGTSGAAPTISPNSSSTVYQGNGGSGGDGGRTGFTGTTQSGGGDYQAGGTYGAGGGGGYDGGPGAQGAVRIIWPGDTRQYPSTNTEDA